WGARLFAGGAPIDVSIHPDITQSKGSNFMLEAQTTVAPSARLTLHPEGVLQDLFEAIGLWRELELGDSAFDPAFVVRGDEATARAFLTPAVRRALLAIGEEAGLRVAIDHGRARLYARTITRRAIERAIEALAAWHAMPSPHPLLRDADATA